MNLKYNRLDMKNKVIDGRRRVGLRSKASTHHYSLTSTSYNMNKKIKKQLKMERKFGEDLTNRPSASLPNSELAKECIINEPANQIQQQQSNQIQPYMLSICDHIAGLDDKFHAKLFDKIEESRQAYHPEITLEMRHILLKWLIQVADKFGLCSETLHICAQIIDYILIFSADKINKKNVQLLGVTALFVASKYNEIHTLQAEKYVLACDGLYSMGELFQMESVILVVTNFNLQFPTLHQFTSQLFHNQNISEELGNRIRSLCNLSVFDFRLFNCFKKIHLSTVIIYFSAKLLNLESFKSKMIIEEAKMSEEAFNECLLLLARLYRERRLIS